MRVIGNLEWERALFGVLREIEERGGRLIASAVQSAGTRAVGAAGPGLALHGERWCSSCARWMRASSRRRFSLRAHTRGFELPDETARWLQRRFPRDMRTLYELLDTLDEAALVAQRRLTVPFIRSVLREQEPAAGPPS